MATARSNFSWVDDIVGWADVEAWGGFNGGGWVWREGRAFIECP